MIKLVCARLRSFIPAESTPNDKSVPDTQSTPKPDMDIGQRAESILESRRQQSAGAGFDVGNWR